MKLLADVAARGVASFPVFVEEEEARAEFAAAPLAEDVWRGLELCRTKK